jgi:ketosteroid isomerase-like protein
MDRHSVALVTIMTLLPSCLLKGGPTSDQSEVEIIKKLERDRLQAGVRKDIQAISLATAEDYVQIDIDGKILNKAATLERIRSSYAQLQAIPVEEMVVRFYGDAAVITGRANPSGSINGSEQHQTIRYSRVYVKRDRRWQVVLFQQTRIKE